MPLPTIYPSPERRKLSPQSPPHPLPSRPQFPMRGREYWKSKEHLSPLFLPAGAGGFSCFMALSPNSPLSSGCASRPRHLVATSGRFSTKKGRGWNRRGQWDRTRDEETSRVRPSEGGDVRWSGWGGGHRREVIGAPGVRVKAKAIPITRGKSWEETQWPRDLRQIPA